MLVKIGLAIIGMLVLFLIQKTLLQDSIKNKNEADIGWYDFNEIDMTMSGGDSQKETHWILSVDRKNDDYFIEKEEYIHDVKTKGFLGVISGKMMISKGLNLEEGYEIDAVDSPMLMMQVLLSVLEHVASAGPRAIKGKESINHQEAKQSIKVSTTSASGVFSAPWCVTGFLDKNNENLISYDLRFESSLNKGHDSHVINLKGRWSKIKYDGLPDKMSLEGWKVYLIGIYSKSSPTGTMVDYGAQLQREDFAHLGALREEIRRIKKSEEVKDSAKSAENSN